MLGLGLGLWLGSRGVSAAAWTPADLGASLIGWFDAEQASTLSLSGSAVTGWTDVKSGLVLSQATSAFRPIYSATSLNGRPGVSFDGTDDQLENASVVYPTGATPVELWALIDQRALAGDGVTSRTIFSYGGGANITRRIRRSSSAGTNRGNMQAGNGTTTVSRTGTNVDFSGVRILRGQFTGTQLILTIDGTAEGSATVTPATGTGRTRMGASDPLTPGEFTNGIINAIIITAPLDGEQASRLYNWLDARRAPPPFSGTWNDSLAWNDSASWSDS